MKILFFGDVVGKPGRAGLKAVLENLKVKLNPDLVIANAENVAHGIGVTIKTVGELYACGVDFLTSGNHVFDRHEQVGEVFEKFSGRIIRPANFSGTYPGRGWEQIEKNGKKVLLINLNAQVFMEKQFDGFIESPFKALDEILQSAPKSDIIIVDFHSEATSEKRAFGFYADGRVTAVVGTHTHIQTSDAQVLSKGTAYLSDVGMCGAGNSVLGVKSDSALKRFLNTEKSALEISEEGPAEINYAVIGTDESNQAVSIEAVREIVKI